MLPQPGNLAEHLGISDRRIADVEDQQIHAPKRSGSVEQVREIGHCDDPKIGQSLLKRSTEAVPGQGLPIDQDDRHALSGLRAVAGFASEPEDGKVSRA